MRRMPAKKNHRTAEGSSIIELVDPLPAPVTDLFYYPGIKATITNHELATLSPIVFRVPGGVLDAANRDSAYCSDISERTPSRVFSGIVKISANQHNADLLSLPEGGMACLGRFMQKRYGISLAESIAHPLVSDPMDAESELQVTLDAAAAIDFVRLAIPLDAQRPKGRTCVFHIAPEQIVLHALRAMQVASEKLP